MTEGNMQAIKSSEKKTHVGVIPKRFEKFNRKQKERERRAIKVASTVIPLEVDRGCRAFKANNKSNLH